MRPNDIDRRRFLRVAGATAAATLVAGCTAEGDSNDDTGDGDGGFVASEEEPNYGGFMDDVPNYEGAVDRRGEETITVTVGAGDQGLTFEPPAVMIDPGTTVVWEWSGEGGAHNVTSEDGEFESELVDEAGHTFEHTFEDPDVYEYACTPHQANGMKGAVAVDEG